MIVLMTTILANLVVKPIFLLITVIAGLTVNLKTRFFILQVKVQNKNE